METLMETKQVFTILELENHYLNYICDEIECDDVKRVFVYEDCYYILQLNNGEFYTILDWSDIQSNNLEVVERELFRYIMKGLR